jgi:hypothetical protein
MEFCVFIASDCAVVIRYALDDVQIGGTCKHSSRVLHV